MHLWLHPSEVTTSFLSKPGGHNSKRTKMPISWCCLPVYSSKVWDADKPKPTSPETMDTETDAVEARIDQYEAALCNLLNSSPPNSGSMRGKETPIKVLDYLYLGTFNDAEDFPVLQRLGITHVINCAAVSPNATVAASLSRYGVFKYLPFYAEDIDDYNITQHFTSANKFINEAKRLNGRVLVHCMKGINRSVCVILGYLLADMRTDLFRAVNDIRRKRPRILTNPSFRRQLVVYADSLDLLPTLKAACSYYEEQDNSKQGNVARTGSESNTSPLV